MNERMNVGIKREITFFVVFLHIKFGLCSRHGAWCIQGTANASFIRQPIAVVTLQLQPPEGAELCERRRGRCQLKLENGTKIPEVD